MHSIKINEIELQNKMIRLGKRTTIKELKIWLKVTNCYPFIHEYYIILNTLSKTINKK